MHRRWCALLSVLLVFPSVSAAQMTEPPSRNRPWLGLDAGVLASTGNVAGPGPWLETGFERAVMLSAQGGVPLGRAFALRFEASFARPKLLFDTHPNHAAVRFERNHNTLLVGTVSALVAPPGASLLGLRPYAALGAGMATYRFHAWYASDDMLLGYDPVRRNAPVVTALAGVRAPLSRVRLSLEARSYASRFHVRDPLTGDVGRWRDDVALVAGIEVPLPARR